MRVLGGKLIGSDEWMRAVQDAVGMLLRWLMVPADHVTAGLLAMRQAAQVRQLHPEQGSMRGYIRTLDFVE